MASPILSAATAPAFELSVATVVTGTKGSTPESKPMTGILASAYFWRIGWSALPSRAAKQSAAGFLASSCWSREICTSTWDSLSGPMKLIVTPSLVASSWAPCLTATQN